MDIKYLDIPNVCFSLAGPDDNRDQNEFKQQRESRGFDDSELWSLRDTIANFIIPRLKEYIRITNDIIEMSDKDIKRLHRSLKAMELIARDNGSFILTDEEYIIVKKGLRDFSKIFLGLWW